MQWGWMEGHPTVKFRTKTPMNSQQLSLESCNSWETVQPVLAWTIHRWRLDAKCLVVVVVETVKRKFTKSLIICDDNVSYKERLEICELKSLEYRRLLADLYLFYKITNHLIAIDLGDSLLPLPANSVTIGHSRRFKIPPARLNSR